MSEKKPAARQTPLQEALADVRRLRKLISDGDNSETNLSALDDAESDLGRLYADWCDNAAKGAR